MLDDGHSADLARKRELFARKRAEITAQMWRTEFDLQEPSAEGRAIDPEAVEWAFDAALGEAGAAVLNHGWGGDAHDGGVRSGQLVRPRRRLGAGRRFYRGGDAPGRWCADSARWVSSGRHVDHRDRRRVMISM